MPFTIFRDLSRALLNRMPNPHAGFKDEFVGTVELLSTVALLVAQLLVVCVVTVSVVVIPPGDVCDVVEEVVETLVPIPAQGTMFALRRVLFWRTTPL